jgi:Methyltransferase domain
MDEEQIFDISLATFRVHDDESAGPQRSGTRRLWSAKARAGQTSISLRAHQRSAHQFIRHRHRPDFGRYVQRTNTGARNCAPRDTGDGGATSDVLPSPAHLFDDSGQNQPEILARGAGHAPFAFWLVDALRPRTVVELGTYQGFSYFCFCQAVKALGCDTRCVAIDTWQGDAHSGFYGEDVFRGVLDYNASHYDAFSSLIRSTFDAAAAHFSDGSVDLLHIDGCHFYESVAVDFSTWKRTLSDRSVVIFHDTNVRENDFGVHRLWDELRDQFPSFEFKHGHGLGVLGTGSSLPRAVVDFFEAAEKEPIRDTIREVYSRLGAVLELSIRVRECEQQWSLHAREIEDQRVLIGNLRAALSRHEADHAVLVLALSERNSEIETAKEEIARHEARFANVLRSTSWRVTAPLRAARRLLNARKT